MPSPFPGMDPYLEAPDIWPDFHHAFAADLSKELNRTLPEPYYARLEMRPELGIVEAGEARRPHIIPDVVVARSPRRPPGPGGVAVLDQPQADVSRSIDVTVSTAPLRHHFVEIRDSARGHHLVTLIEILSPSNKRRGSDRDAYTSKQRDVLGSDANLIELDLLRAGERVLTYPDLAEFAGRLEPPPDYLVLVNRAWRRAQGEGQMHYQVFPCGLRDRLPCIPVPLRQGEPEILLDLQFVFNRTYDGGPYRRGAVDYAQPPYPPLLEADAGWAEALVRDRGRLPA